MTPEVAMLAALSDVQIEERANGIGMIIGYPSHEWATFLKDRTVFGFQPDDSRHIGDVRDVRGNLVQKIWMPVKVAK